MGKEQRCLAHFPNVSSRVSWLSQKFERTKHGILLTMKVTSWQSSLFPENDVCWTLALWVKEN